LTVKLDTPGLSARTLIVTCHLLLVGIAAGAQPTVRSFDGDKGPGLAACEANNTHCGRQSETNVGASGNQVVQITWQNVAVYDKSGKLLRSMPVTTFIRNAGLDPMPPPAKKGASRGPYEPHVVYDEFIGRWIIGVTGFADCLLVSASSDALGAWGGVYPSCLQGGPCLDFDPGTKLGYDVNGVYFCGAHINDDNPETAPHTAWDCFALPSEEVKAIARRTPPAHLNRVHNIPLDVVPAVDNNPNKARNAPAFFLTKSCDHNGPLNACQKSDNFPFTWLVNTFTWNGRTGTYNSGGAQQVIKTDVGSKANKWVFNTPCCGLDLGAPQAGTDIRVRVGTMHRLMNVMQAGSHLHAVLGSGPCTRDCGSQGTDPNNIMIYVDLDCSNPAACVVAQTGKISGTDVNPAWGTVGVDTQGNVGIVAASVTAKTHPSVLMWWRKKTDAPNVFSGPVTVAAGTAPYTCMKDRTLDDGRSYYVLFGSSVGMLTARDPLDGTKLWTSQQYANDARPCVFSTRVVQYQIAPPASKPSPPEPRDPPY
jgi:hypothetical protein